MCKHVQTIREMDFIQVDGTNVVAVVSSALGGSSAFVLPSTGIADGRPVISRATGPRSSISRQLMNGTTWVGSRRNVAKSPKLNVSP